jgi:hypothetical protein
MDYQQQFFNQQQLKLLRQSALAAVNYTDANEALFNRVQLNDINPLLEQIGEHVGRLAATEVDFLSASIELVCDATLNHGKPQGDTPHWHTDSSNRWVSGECFNVCVPLYNDSVASGLSVIAADDNPGLYQQLGDRSYPIVVYSREKTPSFFALLPPKTPKQIDLLVLNGFEGRIIPCSSDSLQISTSTALQPGDIGVFRHDDIYGSFLQSGIRIELSLKFKSSEAKLNTKGSNELFATYNSLYSDLMGEAQPQSQQLEGFLAFEQQFLAKTKRPKPEVLKVELITELLIKNLN